MEEEEKEVELNLDDLPVVKDEEVMRLVYLMERSEDPKVFQLSLAEKIKQDG